MSEGLYRRGNVWWGRKQIASREIRRSLRTSDRAEARRRYKAWVEALTAAAFGGAERVTWVDAVGQWAAEYLPSEAVKPSVAARYLTSIRQIAPTVRDLYIDQITRRKVAEIISARRKEGASNATIRRDLTALSSVLRFAVSQTWLDANPAREFDRSVIRERRRPFALPTQDQIDAVLAKLSPMARRLATLALHTGMRLGELTSLEWRQIDLERGAITLTKTKSGRPRVVPLDEIAAGTITGTPRKLRCPLVFWHDDGQPYSQFSRIFARAAKQAKYPATFHGFRHIYAIRYLQAGGSIYELQAILGHSSVSTTEVYLAYLSREQAEGAKIGAGTKTGTGTAVPAQRKAE